MNRAWSIIIGCFLGLAGSWACCGLGFSLGSPATTRVDKYFAYPGGISRHVRGEYVSRVLMAFGPPDEQEQLPDEIRYSYYGRFSVEQFNSCLSKYRGAVDNDFIKCLQHAFHPGHFLRGRGLTLQALCIPIPIFAPTDFSRVTLSLSRQELKIYENLPHNGCFTGCVCYLTVIPTIGAYPDCQCGVCDDRVGKHIHKWLE